MSRRHDNAALGWLAQFRPASRPVKSKGLPSRRAIPRIAHSCLVFAVVVICLQLIKIQVFEGSHYRVLANGNRFRERIVYAQRGRILDRKGRVVASNELSTQLVVYPYLLSSEPSRQKEEVGQIGSLIGQAPGALAAVLSQLDKQDIQAHTLADNLDQATIVKLEQVLPKIHGYELHDVPTRHYDSSAGLANIVGYTGRVTQDDLKADASGQLLPTDTVGRTGVEASFDRQLRGTNGQEKIEVDALNRPISLLAQQAPQPGKDVTLTIDLDIQKQLETSIKKQLETSHTSRGAGVVVDPRTGDVLAMVSVPYADNNEFVRGVSQARYDALLHDPDQPLLNRVLSNGYPTGSIIKPLVASAALEEKVVTPDTTVVDRGFLELTSQYDPGVHYRFNGWNPNGLGAMQVRSALAFSSNIYFFTVGGGYESQKGLGVDRLTKYYHLFGLGEDTGINLPNELAGRVPDPAWKKKATGEDWFVGDTYNISIGQGDMIVSPLQITMAEAAVANGGKLMVPRIVSSDPVQVRRELPIDAKNLAIVREGLRQAVTNGVVPASIFTKVPVGVAGKSGTAETNSPGGRPPHAWFMGYAPYDNPQILATVLLEEGKEGGRYSAPAVADVFASYFSARQP